MYPTYITFIQCRYINGVVQHVEKSTTVDLTGPNNNQEFPISDFFDYDAAAPIGTREDGVATGSDHIVITSDGPGEVDLLKAVEGDDSQTVGPLRCDVGIPGVLYMDPLRFGETQVTHIRFTSSAPDVFPTEVVAGPATYVAYYQAKMTADGRFDGMPEVADQLPPLGVTAALVGASITAGADTIVMSANGNVKVYVRNAVPEVVATLALSPGVEFRMKIDATWDGFTFEVEAG